MSYYTERSKMLRIVVLSTIVLLQLYAQSIDFSKGKWQSLGDWTTNREGNTSIVSLVKPSGEDFNLYFTKDYNFSNGTLSVQFKANSGTEDQGGGIAWGVEDEDNYLVARFNPLEDNFRFYTVTDGLRVERESSNIKLSSGWHTMTIKVNLQHYKLSLDGKELLDFTLNSKLQKSGGIGVWTKADALSSFKNFTIGK